jgi:hypothetical protein
LLSGGHDFFKEVKKYRGQKHTFSNTMNNTSGDDSKIAQVFADEYQSLYNSCEYDITFPESMFESLSVLCSQNEKYSVEVSAADIELALKHIKNDKADGTVELVSNHFIKSPQILKTYLAQLLSLCITHCYMPSSLLLSTIIPIPKDKMGNLADTNNYRGIALCALCLKIFEYVILIKHSGDICSSDAQFAFKKNSSTTQCTWVGREIISYYNSNGSPIYACLLDCSKAFDKIRCDTLFNKLIHRGVSPFIVRLLLYMYTHSEVRVKWNCAVSDKFQVTNGVRQGAVLSPLLFNVYIDDLIADLQNNGAGCWVGSQYYGAIVYADDILLLAPTISALSEMLQICETFGKRHGLNFNSKKTVCVHFHADAKCESLSSLPVVTLNGETLVWCKTAKHLGHTLTCCLQSNKDINIKKGNFIACVNDVMTEFAFAHPYVKQRLLNIYGSSFYGSSLWDLYSVSAKSLYTTWNIAIRKTFGLPYRTHTRFLEYISGSKHLSIILKMRFIRFVQTLCRSENVLIKNLIHVCLYDNTSPTGLNMSRILSEFNLCGTLFFDIYNKGVEQLVFNAHTSVSTLSSEEMSICSVIKELIECLNGTHTNGLPFEQCHDLMSLLCTM